MTSYCYCNDQMDHGSNPYVINIGQAALQSPNFRTAVWTGCHLQMTVMCIPPCGEIGLEVHGDTDQLIRVEQGTAAVKTLMYQEKTKRNEQLLWSSFA